MILYLFYIEFDPAKSKANKEKHGIDFEECQQLWEDENRIEIDAVSRGEQRFAIIGQIREKIWIAYITYRHENIRIISVRRARKAEARLYENAQTQG